MLITRINLKDFMIWDSERGQYYMVLWYKNLEEPNYSEGEQLTGPQGSGVERGCDSKGTAQRKFLGLRNWIVIVLI